MPIRRALGDVHRFDRLQTAVTSGGSNSRAISNTDASLYSLRCFGPSDATACVNRNSDSSALSRSFELSKRTSMVTKPRISSADNDLVSLLPSLATTIRASNLRFPILSPYLLRRSSACMFVNDDLDASDMDERSPPPSIKFCGDWSQNESTMNFAALITELSEPSRGVNLTSIDSLVVLAAAVSSSAASVAKNMSSFMGVLLRKAAPFVENDETKAVWEPQRADAASRREGFMVES
mmetsp:Transcript_24661/g.49184  ORF Transcript_24661/g.49184 Transcript_24661/m.49184 type:complete len:237 (-) Transcript_24661:55-765(-)